MQSSLSSSLASAKRDESLLAETTHRPLSSSFLGLPYRILHMNHKKELLRGLWVYLNLTKPTFL